MVDKQNRLSLVPLRYNLNIHNKQMLTNESVVYFRNAIGYELVQMDLQPRRGVFSSDDHLKI